MTASACSSTSRLVAACGCLGWDGTGRGPSTLDAVSVRKLGRFVQQSGRCGQVDDVELVVSSEGRGTVESGEGDDLVEWRRVYNDHAADLFSFLAAARGSGSRPGSAGGHLRSGDRLGGDLRSGSRVHADMAVRHRVELGPSSLAYRGTPATRSCARGCGTGDADRPAVDAGRRDRSCGCRQRCRVADCGTRSAG